MLLLQFGVKAGWEISTRILYWKLFTIRTKIVRKPVGGKVGALAEAARAAGMAAAAHLTSDTPSHHNWITAYFTRLLRPNHPRHASPRASSRALYAVHRHRQLLAATNQLITKLLPMFIRRTLYFVTENGTHLSFHETRMNPCAVLEAVNRHRKVHRLHPLG